MKQLSQHKFAKMKTVRSYDSRQNVGSPPDEAQWDEMINMQTVMAANTATMFAVILSRLSQALGY